MDAKEEASVLFGRSRSVLYWVTDLDVVLRKQEWISRLENLIINDAEQLACDPFGNFSV